MLVLLSCPNQFRSRIFLTFTKLNSMQRFIVYDSSFPGFAGDSDSGVDVEIYSVCVVSAGRN